MNQEEMYNHDVMSGSQPMPSLSSFIGRERELAELRSLFDDDGARLITITGAPGVGKSRLAARFAEAHVQPWLAPGGSASVMVCDSSKAREAREALWLVGKATGLDTDDIEELSAGLLRRGPSFLVVDTVDHLIPSICADLALLCRRTPTLRMLVTSRESLRVDGEVRYRIAPLSTTGAPSEAATLFIDRLTTSLGGELSPLTRYDESRELLEDLVQLLEGNPLAIELAAARAGLLGLPKLIDRLRNSGSAVLGSGHRDGPAHHVSLEAAVDWSWRLLDDSERTALSQCSVFAADFDIESAEAVIAVDSPDAPEPLELLSRLLDCSLIEARPESRFRLTEIVRAFARRHLSKEEQTEARHTSHVLSIAGEHRRRLHRGEEVTRTLQALTMYREELLLVARRYLHTRDDRKSSVLAGVDAVLALETTMVKEGAHPTHELLVDEALQRIADAPELIDPEREARLKLARARLFRCRGSGDEAMKMLHEAHDVAESGRALAPLALALTDLAVVACRAGDPGGALEMATRAVAAAKESEDRRALAISTGGVAFAHFATGSAEAATPHLRRAISLAQQIGDADLEAEGQGILGNWEHAAGHYEAARLAYRSALEKLQSTSEVALEAIFSGYLAVVEHELGEHDSTLRRFNTALEGLSQAPVARHEALFHAFFAAALAGAGRQDEARLARERAICISREMTHDRALSRVVELAEGHLQLAEARRALAGDDRSTLEGATGYARSLLESTSASGDDDVTIAERLLRRELARVEGETESFDRLEVAVDGAWFRVTTSASSGAKVELKRRRALKSVLLCLARSRRDSPGRGIATAELVATGWPDESMTADSGRHRVRVAIYTLRKLGLEEAIETQGDRYLLSPSLSLRLVDP